MSGGAPGEAEAAAQADAQGQAARRAEAEAVAGSVTARTGPLPASRRGRRPGAADTRGRILDFARTTFADRGFDGTTIREVAGRAGVDPALVHHYFGTKQQLFVAAMRFPLEINDVFPAIAAGPRDQIGERIVAAFVGLWDRPDVRPTLLGIARSATTDPVAAAMFRRVLVDGPLQALAGLLATPDAPLRATLVGSQLIGIAMVRYVAELEPIASMGPDGVATLVGPTLTRYLLADLAADAGESGSFHAPAPGPVR